jgi:hypothetical protein
LGPFTRFSEYLYRGLVHLHAARELFTAASEQDPRFATTLAQLTFVNLWEVVLGWAYVMAGDIDNGLEAAWRAVDLNPSMPEAWGWLSWNLLVAGDAEGSITSGQRAQRLAGHSLIFH